MRIRAAFRHFGRAFRAPLGYNGAMKVSPRLCPLVDVGLHEIQAAVEEEERRERMRGDEGDDG